MEYLNLYQSLALRRRLAFPHPFVQIPFPASSLLVKSQFLAFTFYFHKTTETVLFINIVYFDPSAKFPASKRRRSFRAGSACEATESQESCDCLSIDLQSRASVGSRLPVLTFS
ncbi:hypothetical protein V6N13_129529 [Hibiscus sabdariffa]|uniref:Uncharacterized protein n=1 Tax=Hibiscus sabdariffa TaxID=183260 RepID=A0ABR2SLH8_9ROSI